VLGEPLPAHPGLATLHVVEPGTRQDLAQVQVAALILCEQQQPARLLLAAVGGEPHVRAEQGLDALLARGAVELDRAEHVRQVGDGQRTLPVRGRARHEFVDAQGAVDDGELGVGAQVNKIHW
jgi:hypothetical protein